MVDVDESAVWRCAVKEYVDKENGETFCYATRLL